MTIVNLKEIYLKSDINFSSLRKLILDLNESKLSLSQLGENLLNSLKDMVKAEDYESFRQKVLDEYEDISQWSKGEYLVFDAYDVFNYRSGNSDLLLCYKDLRFNRTHDWDAYDWDAYGWDFIPLDKVDTGKLLDYLQEALKNLEDKEPRIKHILLFISPHDLNLQYRKREDSKYLEYSN